MLVEGGYLVTNSHVVWPNTAVKVTFPDGTVVQNTPVVGWDLMADLAVLGPVSVSARPVALSDASAPPVGSEVLTVGYPGSPGDLPQPTLGSGLVSRHREWQQAGLTYIQSSAPIESGQSGGALISANGEVVGLTTYSTGETNQGLALASTDVALRVRSIIAGNDPSGIGKRLFLPTGGDIRHSGTLGTFWDTSGYVIQEPMGTRVSITLDGHNDFNFTVFDSTGLEVLFVDASFSGMEEGSFIIEYAESYFVVVGQSNESEGTFTISATHALTPVPDPDDQTDLRIGQAIQGSLDYPGDIDTYTIHLSSANKIQMETTSFALDTRLSIDFYGASYEEIIFDDDSGGGLFETDAQIIFRASRVREYFIVVDDNWYETGGYTLSIKDADPAAQLTQTTFASLFDLPERATSFGPEELRAAFNNLPPEFGELDLEEEGLSRPPEEFDDFLQHGIGFSVDDPLQIMLAYSGISTEEDRLGIELLSRSPETLLKYMTAQAGFDNRDIIDSGTLDVGSVGENAVGVWFEMGEEVVLVASLVMFVRGEYVGTVVSLVRPDTSPPISPRQAAQLLDAAFIEYLTNQ